MRQSHIDSADGDYARRIEDFDRAMKRADIIAEPVAYGILNIGEQGSEENIVNKNFADRPIVYLETMVVSYLNSEAELRCRRRGASAVNPGMVGVRNFGGMKYEGRSHRRGSAKNQE